MTMPVVVRGKKPYFAMAFMKKVFANIINTDRNSMAADATIKATPFASAKTTSPRLVDSSRSCVPSVLVRVVIIRVDGNFATNLGRPLSGRTQLLVRQINLMAQGLERALKFIFSLEKNDRTFLFGERERDLKFDFDSSFPPLLTCLQSPGARLVLGCHERRANGHAAQRRR